MPIRAKRGHVSRKTEPQPKHLDNGFGYPVCYASAEGALLVDEPVNTTCPACLYRLANLLHGTRVRGM